MSHHSITTPASPSLASPQPDAAFDSIESLTTTFTSPVLPTLETTTVTEVALGYHRNQQYSITAMTTSSGAVAERYAYTAYGQPTICYASGCPIGNQQSQIANRFTYTGREWDETLGLYHFRARWMSPLAGRFMGRDPIGYEDGPLLLYSFVSAKYLSSLDPFGLIAVWQDHYKKPHVSNDGHTNCDGFALAPCMIAITPTGGLFEMIADFASTGSGETPTTRCPDVRSNPLIFVPTLIEPDFPFSSGVILMKACCCKSRGEANETR
jgi:RHS repeat-associated protein